MKRYLKLFKRAVALLLVVTMYTSSQLQVQAMAAAGSSPDNLSLTEQAMESQNDDIDHYIDFTKDMTFDMFDEVLDAWKDLFTDEGGYLDDVMDAINKGTNLDKTFSFGLKVLDWVAGVTNLLDAIQCCVDVFDLQGRTLGTQLIEVMLLTFQFAAATLAIFGFIGFPLNLILGCLFAIVLNAFRSGMVDDEIDEMRRQNGGEFNNVIDRFMYYPLPNRNNVYKPNIYIYSEKPQEFVITFIKPKLLTTTIPEYKDSWKVTTKEHGELIDNKGDSYGFLFYESITDASLFQTETGYKIPGNNRDESFKSILKNLNFNNQEIEDFVEFWDNKLPAGEDYVMYPQDTKKVDKAMPIEISGRPDSVERIWFVFDKASDTLLKEPKGYELKRAGSSYVIEWGGLILGE